MDQLRTDHAGRVETLVGDLAADMNMGQKAVNLAIEKFGRLDGIVLNHGTLGAVARLSEASVEEWKKGFDINVFSAIAVVCRRLRRTGRSCATRTDVSTRSKPLFQLCGPQKARFYLPHLALRIGLSQHGAAMAHRKPC